MGAIKNYLIGILECQECGGTGFDAVLSAKHGYRVNCSCNVLGATLEDLERLA